MALVKEYNLVVSVSPFNCPICNSLLEYVQVVEGDEIRIHEDYFQCKTCFTHIDNKQLDEDLPGFCD